MTQKNIESVLLEERTFPPPAEFARRARIKAADAERMRRAAEADHVGFWADLARSELLWKQPFTVALDDSEAPYYRWFTDGRLNASVNCLDVHLETRGDKAAIVFEGERGDIRRLSYRELHAEVCRFARALQTLGLRKGDRVIIYMPLIPETVIAMHACNRIGAIHSVVFGGFSAPALKDRIEDTGARLLITADGGFRGGRAVELKAAADKALSSGCGSIERVIVFQRTRNPINMQADRDLWWHDVIEGQPTACEPEWVEAEHPLFLLYTSGSTGKPKGIQHSTGGYLLGAKATTQWIFDLRDDDVFWCTADVGWVTGHSYVAYGPLAAGATVVLYEGAPIVPDPGRFWSICERHRVSVFYTAPTAIRALMKLGEEWPAQYDLSRLRLLGSVGEPINPEAWMWYQRVIGGGRCPIVDTWWQTETGAILISPLPGVTPTKPGSCTEPLPGIDAAIVDERGRPVNRPEAGGFLVIRKPWPSMLRTLWRDNERYIGAYWQKFGNRYYVAGDSARRDANGYFWIMGRIDDVLNVAGHRLGTMEIESALVAHPRIAEAAVVGRPHEIKGEAVFAYVVCKGARPTGDSGALVKELRDWVAEQLGAIARPEEIRFADNLPKTRSGKIMRRLLRSIARGEEILQDVSTLENPAILDQLRGVEGSTGSVHTPARQRKRDTTTKSITNESNDRRTRGDAGKIAAAKSGASKKSTARAGTVRMPGAKTSTAKEAVTKKAATKKAAKRMAAAKKAAPEKRAASKRAAKKRTAPPSSRGRRIKSAKTTGGAKGHAATLRRSAPSGRTRTGLRAGAGLRARSGGRARAGARRSPKGPMRRP